MPVWRIPFCLAGSAEFRRGTGRATCAARVLSTAVFACIATSAPVAARRALCYHGNMFRVAVLGGGETWRP